MGVVIAVVAAFGCYSLLKTFAEPYCYWQQIGPTAVDSRGTNNLYVHFYELMDPILPGSCYGNLKYWTHVDFYQGPWKPGGSLVAKFGYNSAVSIATIPSTAHSSRGNWTHADAFTGVLPKGTQDLGIGKAVASNGQYDMCYVTSPSHQSLDCYYNY